MKKILKTAGWQIGAFVLAIGAAFATNAMKDTTLFAVVDGYQQMNSNPQNCQKRDKCSTNGVIFCTWLDSETDITHRLYEKIIDPITLQTKCTKTLFIKE